jgi:hypothetical protein
VTIAETPPDETTPEAPAEAPDTYARRLMHRWFVEYNPLYLLSAMLVLVGLTLLSRAAADQGTAYAELGYVPIIAEGYAFSLIAGAALLTRIGHRRPAVMLGLLTVLYQGDLTLLTERQIHLGPTGKLAAAGWLIVFVVKLYALAWALKLRLSQSFVAVSLAFAGGLVVLPHYLSRSDATSKEAVVSGWIFALLAALLWGRRGATSKVPLDAWQRKVLSRSLLATWTMWATLAMLHVAFWAEEFHVRLHLLIPAAMLLSTRWMKREQTVWSTALGTLVAVARFAPGALSEVALMAAVVLVLRALVDATTTTQVAGATRRADGYRLPGGDETPPAEVLVQTLADPAARVRLLGGAMFAIWLSAWTRGWTGGALPAHVLALDLTLTLAAILFARKTRARAIFAPLSISYAHFAMQAGLVSPPSSSLQWGVTTIVTGFVLLIGSLVLGWKMRPRTEEPVGPG